MINEINQLLSASVRQLSHEGLLTMRFIRSTLLLAPFLLAGCTDTLLSDDRIKSNTAASLGVPADSLTITDRRSDGLSNTYYTASTAGRSYACTIADGSVLSMGITGPLTCTPK